MTGALPERSFRAADTFDATAEWLEADGLGGFASGPVIGARRRRYHALLLTATQPPAGRVVQVNGVEAWLRREDSDIPLSTNHYLPDVIYPEGFRRLVSFSGDPWPCWVFDLGDGARLEHDLFVAPDCCETVLRWRLMSPVGSALPAGRGGRDFRLEVRPLLSGRDYHALHRENAGFAFAASVQGGNVAWRPYPNLPAVGVLSNGSYRHDPQWFRNLRYDDERERGLEDVEDVAAPGVFTWNLADGEAVLVLRAGDGLSVRTAAHIAALAAREAARRAAAGKALDRAADAYVVDRTATRGDGGRTLLAGFPWFTDWGRDTFIAMRGLLIARGRLGEAAAILDAWADTVSEGMIPNRFTDQGGTAEYNSVDASLWFIVAGAETLSAAGRAGAALPDGLAARLALAWETILRAYAAGTRYRIGADRDGLLRAGVPGVQLTWMDAKVGDWVVTPRIGKPVEVQALWINALRIAARLESDDAPRWQAIADQAAEAFAARFANPATGGLYDVVDVDHVRGVVDAQVRPNQIFAVGGLPEPLLTGAAARRLVAHVEQTLLTPLGLRSLAPSEAAYRGSYRGDIRSRDGAYHQGTVWPWLMGPFIEAWLRTSDNPAEAVPQARARFLAGLATHRQQAGIDHISEIADGDPPHAPRGCPFQAWSLGEFIRAGRMLDDAAC
jgi:predicted glycogen debranching enzyme